MRIEEIALKKIIQIENSRVDVGDVSELMRSIKDQGLMSPLVVTVVLEGHKNEYVLCAGNRRFHALKNLGYTSAPCVIRDDIYEDKELIITNLTENIQRKQISPWEEGRYIYTLLNEFKMSHKEVAVRLSITTDRLNVSLSLFKETPEKYRKKIIYKRGGKGRIEVGKIAPATALKINTLKTNHKLTTGQADELYNACISGKLGDSTVSQIAKIMAKGHTLDTAIHAADKIIHVRNDFYLTKYEKDRLQAKHPGKSITLIAREILYGRIHDHFNDPISEMKEVDYKVRSEKIKTKSTIKVRKSKLKKVG